MSRLVIDTECTGAQRNKAHPFDLQNKMCCVGIKPLGEPSQIYKIEYDEEPYGEQLEQVKSLVEGATLLILFNGKYDLHWLRRYGITPSGNCRIFDCQLAFFILNSQRYRFPSLDQTAEWCGVEKKLDIVATEYWDKGLDTDDAPWPILSEYLEQDLKVTEQVYKVLQEKMQRHSAQTVFSLACQDQKVLEEMEWNGFLCDKEKSLKKGDDLESRLQEIDAEMREWFGAPWLNIGSGQHLSALLYGGVIEVDGKEDYIFTYKDGRTATKTRNVKIPYKCERVFVPLEKTALAKEGFYATDEGTLIKLREKATKANRKPIDLLLERRKLEKRRGTYYHGIPKHMDHYGWTNNLVHSNLNQCAVITGRLSSDKPNLQNIEDEVREIFTTRYKVRRNENISN